MNIQTKVKKIAELNDLARTAMGVTARVIQTEGIAALPSQVQSRIREGVEKFNSFTPDNDPYGEHDFGAIEIPAVGRVFWKIDYYDKAMEMHSEDPADPGKTTRVLTIMLASEY
ncbi:MAG TPA: DUF3768 domain-containing protein [Nitrospiraceae bacterium]|jgi:hypothetical protein|nr:DUF3768 domain-containing protein [Nitrospiraceae bacterium]